MTNTTRKTTEKTNQPPAAPPVRNCGECLMDAVEIVRLSPAGICPRCGANYGA